MVMRLLCGRCGLLFEAPDGQITPAALGAGQRANGERVRMPLCPECVEEMFGTAGPEAEQVPDVPT